MGSYVKGKGEVTVKKELSAVYFSRMQEEIKKKQKELEKDLTFKIELDAANESGVIKITETTEFWHEDNTVAILNLLVPYITEGCVEYYNEDKRETWRYLYDQMIQDWRRQDARVVYENKIGTSGHGKIILKEKTTPGDRVEIQYNLNDTIKKSNINMTYNCDYYGKDYIIYLYEEGRELWNEEKALKILNIFNPYIKAGIIEYCGNKGCWNYQFDPITKNWKKQYGWIMNSLENPINPISKDNHKQIFTIENVLSITGGNTKVKIIGYEGEIEHFVWTGIVDDYNFEYAPYGHHKAIHISVTNKDISQADNDVLYIYFNYPELTEENKKEIEELKKYFYFCDFPEGGVEQIYYRYGKNTEDYIRNHSMGKILDNIKPVNN